LSWIELQVVVPRRSIALTSQALFDLGAIGLQEDFLPGEAPPVRQPWDTGPLARLPEHALIRAWWEAGSESTESRVAAALMPLEGVGAPRWVDVVDEGWAESWRTLCQRVVVDESLAIAPPWKAEPGDLIIEPGMAFGTGEHPTTISCLSAVVRHANAAHKCLDVGTGSGVLAIAAARLGMDAWGIDIEPESVVAAHENAARNGVAIRADQTMLSDVDGNFELVVANLFAEVLVALSDDLKRVCAGHLAVAGVLTDRADTVVDALAPMRVLRRQEQGDWTHMEFGW
jgi:ribosomal protein L11 methyltransferase